MSRGVTLLELVIAMSVLSIAMVVLFYAFTVSMNIFSSELSEADSSMSINTSLERMTKELRGALEIVSPGSTSISFWYKDLNGNGTREANETLVYSWTAGTQETLYRTTSAGSYILAYNVKSLQFTYDNPSAPKVVNIRITVKKGGNISTLESSVKSRNL